MGGLLQSTDFWEGLGLVAVIALFLFRRIPAMIGKALDARAAAIQTELTQAKQLRDEAEAILVRYTERASKAQAEAQTILSDARAEAERFAAESRAALKAQIERRARAAQERIAQAEAQAVAEVRALAAEAAVAAAERLIADRLTADRAKALIDDAVRQLPAKLN